MNIWRLLFISIFIISCTLNRKYDRNIASKNLDSTCKEHYSFQNKTIKSATVFSDFSFYNTESTKLLLIGEAHLDHLNKKNIYNKIISSHLNGKEDISCIFLEMDDEHQKAYNKCSSKNMMSSFKEIEKCDQTLSYAIVAESWYLNADIMYKKGSKVILIDNKRIKDEDDLSYYKKRNLYMAQRISKNFKNNNCQYGVGIFGAAHLTGNEYCDYKTVQYYLDNLKFNDYKSILAIETQYPKEYINEVWTLAKYNKEKERLDPVCRQETRLHNNKNLIIKKENMMDYPLLPLGLNEFYNTPFGNWKSFDYSVIFPFDN